VSVEEKNKGLVREFFGEAWGKGNMAAVDEYMAADYVEHPRPSNLPAGTEGLKQLIAAYRTAFVTCFYCILDPKSGTLSYANAGHDLPYLSHGGDVEELRATGMPLGLMPEMGYEEKEAVLTAVLIKVDPEANNQRGRRSWPHLQA
jgi:Stage II sporulation protein E (SpoIIE)